MVRIRTTRELMANEGLDFTTLRRKAAAGSLRKVRHGVYVDADAPSAATQQALTRHREQIEAVARTREDIIVAGVSAAAWWGLPMPTREMCAVTVYSKHGHGRLCAGVRQRLGSLEEEDTELKHGVQVTGVARTIVDLARWDGVVWGLIGADAALRRGLTTRAQLLDAVARAGRVQRLGYARRAIALADPRAESPLESLSRYQMIKLGVELPELQYGLRLPDGTAARTDFAWLRRRVVGECDGGVKYSEFLEPGQTAKSVVLAKKRREELIRELGWWVFRWTWREAWDLAVFEKRLRAGLAAGRAMAS